jgi:hypothetical protein
MPLLFLIGCSSSTISIKGEGYENKIRRSVVKRYSNNEVWQLNATQLGYVESEHCQVDFRDRKQTKHALISSLEVKTQKLGGNALVFDSCLVSSTTASCHQHTKCRGIAYLVK